MAAAVVVAALVTGAWVLAARPHAEPVQAVRTSVQSAHPAMQSGARASPAGSRPDSAALSSGAVLVVDVAGKVRRPGIYQLPSGARVDDALRAAGGVLPGVDSTMLNLAAKISDGEQIVVGVGGAVAGGAASAGTAAGGPLELNSASVEQLQSLPGVGPVLAQHIVDWRSAHGRFASVDQLREVSGIGPAKLAAIRALVAV